MTIEVRWSGYSVHSDNIPIALEFNENRELVKVKAGSRPWFKLNPDKVAVAWTEDENEIIQKMGADCPRLAAFPECWGTYEQKCRWLDR